MTEEEEKMQVVDMDEEDIKAAKKGKIRGIIYFSVLILLIIACIIVVVVLKGK